MKVDRLYEELEIEPPDAVRVAHTPRATYCDFLIHDRLDSKLVSIGAPHRACVATANR